MGGWVGGFGWVEGKKAVWMSCWMYPTYPLNLYRNEEEEEEDEEEMGGGWSALELIIAKGNIFARMSPQHKQDLVRALQDTGLVVCMTGTSHPPTHPPIPPVDRGEGGGSNELLYAWVGWVTDPSPFLHPTHPPTHPPTQATVRTTPVRSKRET